MTSPFFKIIICFTIISFLVLYPLQIVKADGGWLLVAKEYALDLVGRVIARVLMSTLSNTVVGKILTSGREIIPGSGIRGPAFIQDWRNFQQSAQYRGEDVFRAQLADATIGSKATICSYMSQALASVFNASPIQGFNASAFRVNSLDYFNMRNKCTLPTGFNANSFVNNFAQGGGWATWEKLIQPQNNFFGTYADSLTELNNQRNQEQNLDSSEAQSGNGYESKRTGCALKGGNQECLILGNVVTPGQMLGDSAVKTIDAEFSWLTSSDEIQEALVSLAGVVGNRLVNFAGDLTNKLGETQGALGPPAPEPTPRPDAVDLAKQGCLDSHKPDCTLKAQKLDCTVSATGGNGGNGGTASNSSGGDGGSATDTCTTIIDASIYSSCMAEANTVCGL